MDRQQLMEAWAKVIFEGRDKPIKPKATPETELELQKQRLVFEKMKYEQERTERLEREKENKQIRLRDIELKAEELSLQRDRDAREQERRSSLAGRTKFYAEALKHMIGKLPSDPAYIPAFFENLENMFISYEVPDDVKPKILQAHLSKRAKSLTARLSREKLDSYKELKQFLLKEFRISPVQLRDRFYSLHKAADETYTMLASKLQNALVYYLKSRNIVKDDTKGRSSYDQSRRVTREEPTDFDKLVSLICADRLKELISKSCLDYILAQEKDSWLNMMT